MGSHSSFFNRFLVLCRPRNGRDNPSVEPWQKHLSRVVCVTVMWLDVWYKTWGEKWLMIWLGLLKWKWWDFQQKLGRRKLREKFVAWKFSLKMMSLLNISLWNDGFFFNERSFGWRKIGKGFSKFRTPRVMPKMVTIKNWHQQKHEVLERCFFKEGEFKGKGVRFPWDHTKNPLKQWSKPALLSQGISRRVRQHQVLKNC